METPMLHTPADSASARLGRTIKALMAYREVTQEELAAATGITQTTISRRLKAPHKFTAEELDAIAHWAGVDPSDLWHPDRVLIKSGFRLVPHVEGQASFDDLNWEATPEPPFLTAVP